MFTNDLRNAVSAFQLIIIAGCTFRVVAACVKGQTEGMGAAEIMAKIRKYIIVGIIATVALELTQVLAGYFKGEMPPSNNQDFYNFLRKNVPIFKPHEWSP